MHAEMYRVRIEDVNTCSLFFICSINTEADNDLALVAKLKLRQLTKQPTLLFVQTVRNGMPTQQYSKQPMSLFNCGSHMLPFCEQMMICIQPSQPACDLFTGPNDC